MCIRDRVAPTWGVNNRSVALRVPAGDARNRRIEHRPSGVDANPYLVAATILAGISNGLKEKLDPGPETSGNGYEQAEGTESVMPPDWRSAIEAAKASEFLRIALGDDLPRTFTAIKESEYFRVARTAVSYTHLDVYKRQDLGSRADRQTGPTARLQ